jgi:hypothetical protein
MSIESGHTLAHYRLVEKIGEGGMGVVWRALDTNLDREVAIKILPEAFSADPERLTRFEREAKLLASINHSNIATVYGLHEQKDVRFLAMELIPGSDLARTLDDKPLAASEALSIARQIAAALEATHQRGVIHRDLKPANVYLTPGGEIKVLDFGIARGIEPTASEDALPVRAPERTQPGMILGTVSYMSPEQARGKPLDARADMWSFGCLLFRMLSGRPAFHGETRWDRLAAVLREDPEWSALPADTPETIRDLLQRCLEKEPDRRLGDAGEARRIIDDALAEFTSPALAAAAAESLTAEPVHRSGTLMAAVAAVLVVAAAAVGLWMLLGGRDSQPDGDAPVGDRRSIAVLPFQSGGGDENDAFTEGIHDDILNQLAKIGDLKVISRTSVMEYRETSKSRHGARGSGSSRGRAGAHQRPADRCSQRRDPVGRELQPRAHRGRNLLHSERHRGTHRRGARGEAVPRRATADRRTPDGRSRGVRLLPDRHFLSEQGGEDRGQHGRRQRNVQAGDLPRPVLRAGLCRTVAGGPRPLLVGRWNGRSAGGRHRSG